MVLTSNAFSQPTFDPTNPPLGIASGAVVYYPWKITLPNNIYTNNPDGSGTINLGTAGYFTNPMTMLGDIIYGGAGGLPTRYGIGAANTVLHANGTPQWSKVIEDDISLSNVTTNNATVVKHGFLPTIPGDPTQYLNGNGNFSTPSGVINSYKSQSFTAVSSVSVVHNFGAKPVVDVLDTMGNKFIPWKVNHDTNNTFSVQFSVATSGVILATVGSPQPQNVITVNSNYTVTATDRIVVVTTEGLTISVPSAVMNTGREYIIKNSSVGTASVVSVILTQPIDGASSQVLTADSAISLFSDGSQYRIY